LNRRKFNQTAILTWLLLAVLILVVWAIIPNDRTRQASASIYSGSYYTDGDLLQSSSGFYGAAPLLRGNGIVASYLPCTGDTSVVNTTSLGITKWIEDPKATPPISGLNRADTPDPDLEPGFPVQTYEGPGTYYSQLATLVGNIDSDPSLELFVSGYANGPLYAFNADGSPQQGWPDAYTGAGYPVLGKFITQTIGLQIFAPHYPNLETAYDGAGNELPGWPRVTTASFKPPPVTFDVDGDGLDEIFLGEDDNALHAYRSDGTVLSGWPAEDTRGGPTRSTPAIADLDGDGVPEVITISDATSSGVYLFAYHLDGTAVDGYPILLPTAFFANYPVVGDVDGDGQQEIILTFHSPFSIAILSSDGTLEHQMPLASWASSSVAPALADLDGDGIPEIVVQSDEALDVFKGDGTSLAGWPQDWHDTGYWMGHSGPVVGDLDGDGQPDVAIMTAVRSTGIPGDVRAFDRFGNLLAGFPKGLASGSGAVPAIADIDNDGRNELIVSGSSWGGYIGLYDKLWAFDLHGAGPYGGIEWGQFGGGPKHQGRYAPTPPTLPCPGEYFTDVCPGDYFHDAALALNEAGILSGYTSSPPCASRWHVPCLKPYNTLSRGQAAKIASNGAGFEDDIPPGQQSYADVPTNSTFWLYIERLTTHGLMNGYPCGGENEPCDSQQRPYFRAGNNVTRGQLSKIVSNAWNYTDTPSAQDFVDVSPSSTFYLYVERVFLHGLVSGYPCGNQGEPCPGTYFRPGNDVTRGQTAKIVYLARGATEADK
jgi:hypothetical protein